MDQGLIEKRLKELWATEDPQNLHLGRLAHGDPTTCCTTHSLTPLGIRYGAHSESGEVMAGETVPCQLALAILPKAVVTYLCPFTYLFTSLGPRYEVLKHYLTSTSGPLNQLRAL